MRAPVIGDSVPCVIVELCGALPSLGGSVGSSLAHDAASAVFGAVTSALVGAAAWLVGHLYGLIVGPTQVQLGDEWFGERAEAMLRVVELVVGPMLLAATIGAVVRQDFRRLARVWAVGLPIALLSGLAAVQFTQRAISATDELCNVILWKSTGNLSSSLRSLVTAMATPGLPGLVADAISLLLIVGSVLVWLELVVRATAIYVAVFFMPLALACYVWPATVSVAKRTVELLVALILSKFVIVATLTLGIAAIGGKPSPDTAVTGAAIILMAAFAPFSLLRLAPIIEAGAIAHLEGMGRRPLRFAGRAATTAAAAPTHPVARLLLSAKSGAAPPAAAPVVAQHVDHRPADYLTSTPPTPGSASA